LKNPFAWEYAITSKNIKENTMIDFGRIIGSLDHVLYYIARNEKDNPVKLFSNPFYRGDFTTDCPHGKEYIHQEKGIGEKVLNKAVGILKEKNVQANWKIMSVSLRYFAGEE
jgi:hypothetical protein